ncbi:MAG: cyclic nucleotide-binding domain-containing protein [Oligoflexia bacterium]|nr:cyclic nucleotide-binding domain-containing protein [Oligoflexia bacterium]
MNFDFGKDVEELEFKNGEEIYLEEQMGNTVYLVKTGNVVLFKMKGDNFIELDSVKPSEMFGYLPFLYKEQRRFTSALATQDTVLINITKPFMKMFETLPELMKMFITSSSRRLKKAYFELGKLQYFENIHYEDVKKHNLQAYHIKDIMRFALIMMLAFDRYNFTITKDYLENIVFSLLSRVTIKIDSLIEAFIECQFITLDQEEQGNVYVNLIDHERLENFNDYMHRNFVKDPRRLLLNDTQIEMIGYINELIKKENQKIIDDFIERKKLDAKASMERDILLKKLQREIDKMVFKFTKNSFTGLDVEVDQTSLVFEGLADRQILNKAPHESGTMEYSITKKEVSEIYQFQKIIKTVAKVS